MINSVDKLLTCIFALSFAVATNAFSQLPPLQSLEAYAKTWRPQPPFYGYDLFDFDKKLYPIVGTGYVTGKSIDELFEIVNDFDGPFWTERFPYLEPSFPPGNAKSVPCARRFTGTYEYVEMKRYSDAENHSLIYTMEWSDGAIISPFICHVTMIDEPENNRVKVSWSGYTQNIVPFFIMKKLQGKTWGSQITDLQKFVDSM